METLAALGLRRYVFLIKMAIFGFFEKVSRPLEILVGIFFIAPAFWWLMELFDSGMTESLADSTVFILPPLFFGIVILLPRKNWRDFLIYFIVFAMAGLSFLIFAFDGFKMNKLPSSLSVLFGIVCFAFSYKYFKKFKSSLTKDDT